MKIPKRLQEWVPLCDHLGTGYGIDPLFLLSLCDRESGGGIYLRPRGPAGVGDCVPRKINGKLVHSPWGGWGLGLWQIDAQFHSEFAELTIGDLPAWQIPEENLRYAITGPGLLLSSKKLFNNDLTLMACAYNCGPGRVQRICKLAPTAPVRHAAANLLTTGRNYGADVVRRMREFHG